jgi:plasmid stability protein
MRTVHVRNVPEDLHAALTARAASEGLTLSEYILAQLRGLAMNPRMATSWPASARGRPSAARQQQKSSAPSAKIADALDP